MADGSSTAAFVCEFLEAVIHEILYLRSLYTREVFERYRLYGIAVHKSRHPELNLYIADSILSLKGGLEHGHIQKVVLRVADAEGKAREQYVFSVQIVQEAAVDMSRAESAVRGCLLKLQFADACMQPLPEGCSFSIDALVDDLACVPIESWVEVDQEDTLQTTSHLGTIVPIKSAVLLPALKLQLHVEVP